MVMDTRLNELVAISLNALRLECFFIIIII